MYIKIFIAIFCVLASTHLFAQDKQSTNQKAAVAAVNPKDSTQKNDQVFLPFGKRPAKALASDISVFKAEDLLKYDNITSVDELLNGRLPAVITTAGINFRGIGNALIVIDGVPRPRADVNISEIDQITILKDANAGMLYGVMANNGVILIKTKRGNPMQKKITALVESGFGSPISYPKYLGSADYMQLYNEAQANDGVLPRYLQSDIDLTRGGTNPLRYPDVNYYNSDFLKNSKPSSRVETQFSGGNTNAQYYANLGWQRTGSLINMGENIHSDRLNLRMNLNFRINDFISSHVDLATVFNIASVPNSDFFGDASATRPNDFAPLIDTLLIGDRKLIKAAAKVNGRYILGGTSIYKNNIYGNLLLGGYNKQFNSTSMFNTGLDIDLKSILKGLTFKTYGSFDFYGQYNETQSNTYAVYSPSYVAGKLSPDSLVVTKIGVDKNTGTQGLANTSTIRDYAFYGILDYSRVFGKHDFSATFMGYMDKRNVSGIFQSDKHSNLGARLNYAYNDKYLVDFSAALVSSPKLSPDNRLGFSPSVSVGWVISNEEFLKNNSLINHLKLSASAGIVNTDMSLTRYYSYDNILSLGATYSWGDAYRWLNATTLTNFSNDNLFFEKRKEYNVGLETSLFNNLLWIDANYFVEYKSDEIILAGLSTKYPSYLGNLNPPENFNEDKYAGLELAVNLRKSVKDFSFDLGPSLLFLDTKATKRDEFWGEQYLFRTGKPIGAIYGLESLGFFNNSADIAASPTQLFGTVVPGDIKYKDQNSDGKIDTNDEIMIGNGNSDILAGLTLNLRYKNLSLFTSASARFGGQTFFNSSYYWISGETRYSEVVLNRWTPATANTATYPRLSSKSNANNFRNSTFWLEDNNLISLNRVQVTYDLPKSCAKKLLTKNFSLYVRGSNLVNFAKNSDKMELTVGSEPQMRYYSAGLKVLF